MDSGVKLIRIDGYREFRADLREVSKELPKEMNRSIKEDVAIPTADAARSSAESQGGALAKGAKSIRGGASGNAVYLRFGGAAYPYMQGAEFGSTGSHGKGNPTPAGGYTTQFRPWRGNGPGAGYAVFPTLRERAPQTQELLENALAEFIASHNLD